jgi:hypothetical protein
MTTAELSAALAQLQEGQALIVNSVVLTRHNDALVVSPHGARGDWKRNKCSVDLLGLNAELTNATQPPGVAANENPEPGLFFARGDLGRWLRACGEGGRLVVEKRGGS